MFTEDQLEQLLTTATSTKHRSYDAVFDAEIRALRPDWFKYNSIAKKQQLRELAFAGKPRPKPETVLGRAAKRYLSPASRSYDAEFACELFARRPDWGKRR